MISYKLFLERKIRNPLRKKALANFGEIPYTSPDFIEGYKNYFRLNDIEDVEDKDWRVKAKYDNLFRSSEALAEKYLDSEVLKIINDLKRPTTRNYKKILENQGVQVFIDEENLEDVNYAPGSYNYRMVNSSVINMLQYIREILPNRKPKIVITDLSKNKYTTDTNNTLKDGAAGMEFSKLIFIDWRSIDEPATYIHEYAHLLTDRIPSQSKMLLVKSFVGLINEYYSKMKKRTIKPGESSRISNRVLANVATKLGFPEYGTRNPDEFFAVVIEKWKELPKNKAGYKFKSLVKNILTRI